MGLLADQIRDRVDTARVTAAGSPGPFERKIASGFIPSTSSAVVQAGTTVTSKPECTRLRKMLRLAPKSYATTRQRLPVATETWSG